MPQELKSDNQSQTTSPNGSPSSLLEVMTALILPWAKKNHPEKYQQTIQIAKNPQTFRLYLIRLIEIRWMEDQTFRSEVPCSVLEETKIVVKLRDRKSNREIEVRGKAATGGRVWGFQELANLNRESFDALMELKSFFDLELVPT
jgi:hypothetical protein